MLYHIAKGIAGLVKAIVYLPIAVIRIFTGAY